MGVVKQIVLIFSFLFLGCGILNVDSSDRKEEQYEEEEFYMEAKVNNKEWWRATDSGTARILPINGVSELIIGGRYFYDRYYYEVLYFAVPVSKGIVGVYDLNRWKDEERGWPYGAFFDEIDWDVVIVSYDPNGDPRNKMTITSYDPSTGIIKGTFHVTFVIDPNWYRDQEKLRELGITPPQRKRTDDTISFTEGRFRVRLIKIE